MGTRVRIASPAYKKMKNNSLQKTIEELKKKSLDEKVNIWKRIASDLERPTRMRRITNLFNIDMHSKDGEIIVVPGKILGTGDLNKKLTIAAYDFSDKAHKKIKKSGSTPMTLEEFMSKNPKGNKARILG